MYDNVSKFILGSWNNLIIFVYILRALEIQLFLKYVFSGGGVSSI